jgi:solute:Na+ symporter, SSS family
MVSLTLLDYAIIAGTLLVCFLPALLFARRSGSSATEFFASGRSVPWWLAGLSMVATTFSADTPNLVTNFVRTDGVAGNWRWWSFVLTGVATVFFYARLWRRSGVMTDLEFYEMRYSGTAAGAVRGFRAVYLGLFFNCIILATVNLALCKFGTILFGLPRWETLLGIGLLNVIFAAQSGLWGVLIIDMIQFFIKMTAVIAAAYFALRQPQVGGLQHLVARLSELRGPKGLNYLNILPDFANNRDLAFTIFIIPLTVTWWAGWYPGSEPGGGSYIAQRMLASKSEKDALGGVLFFNIAHYVLRPWPWILVALCSLLVYPELSDIKKAFPHMDPSLIGDDAAYGAMLKFMPAGWIGLMVGGLIAAGSSTILTHLNWGASYLVHDFYRRFVRKNASERHYVATGRMVTVALFVFACGMTYLLATASDAFNVILQIGAGTGLLYLVRWFWWRVNAWSEIVAMFSSFAISLGWLLATHAGYKVSGDIQFVVTVALTTLCWIATAYLGPETDRQTLMAFYRKVRPAGPGWAAIRREVEAMDAQIEPTYDNIPLSILGWFAGCTAIWSGLFMVGNYLYGRIAMAIGVGILFVVSGSVLAWVVNRVWGNMPAASSQAVAVETA